MEEDTGLDEVIYTTTKKGKTVIFGSHAQKELFLCLMRVYRGNTRTVSLRQYGIKFDDMNLDQLSKFMDRYNRVFDIDANFWWSKNPDGVTEYSFKANPREYYIGLAGTWDMVGQFEKRFETLNKGDTKCVVMYLA